MANAENTIYSPSGDVLYHYKFGDPQYLQLGIGFALSETSIGAQAQKIACRPENTIFLASKKQIASGAKFELLSSTASGDGEIFYRVVSNRVVADASVKEILLVSKLKNERELVLKNGDNAGIKYVSDLNDLLLNCAENKWTIIGTAYYDSALQIAHLSVSSPAWAEFNATSPIALLHSIACNKQFAGIGVLVTPKTATLRL